MTFNLFAILPNEGRDPCIYLCEEGRRPISKKKKAKYDQHIWKEILVSPELFSPTPEFNEDLSEEETLLLREAKLVMRQLLLDRVRELAFQCFTDHQKGVLALTQMPGKTYNQIAEILGINYTGVSHAIKGIKSPKHGGKYHGGFEKKLRRTCNRDKECLLYIETIYVLRDNDPTYALKVLREFDDTDSWDNYILGEGY